MIDRRILTSIACLTAAAVVGSAATLAALGGMGTGSALGASIGALLLLAWACVGPRLERDSPQRGTADSLTVLGRELQDRTSEALLLEDLGRSLVGANDVDRALRYIVDVCGRLGPADTVAVFLERDGRLQAARCSGPHAARSQEHGLVEPVVAAAWRTKAPATLDEVDPGEPRLFAGEQAALALPMPPHGVLYVGATPPGALTDHHRLLFSLVAAQGTLALQSAFHLEQQLRVIRELQRAHQALLKAHSDLEASQAQLVQSSKMAAVGQLAAGVAHEINNPLGAVLLALDSAEGHLAERPDVARRNLARAGKAAMRAREIIRKLLAYARGGTAVDDHVSINDVVTETLDLLGNQLALEGVEIETELTDIAPVRANRHELAQVLTDLLLNARDAVLSESARSRVIGVRTETADGCVRLHVTDHGPGIPEEVQARLFEPFFTTKHVGEGTGLGLSVSQRIVEVHGGTLTVKSSPGCSTVFTVSLPQGTGGT